MKIITNFKMCVMKLNKYFMIGAMGLSLVACSDNLDENGQGANGTNPNEGTTYVAIALDFDNASSRVGENPVDGSDMTTTPPSYDDDIEENSNEADIKTVRIIVTNDEGAVQFNQVVTPKSATSTNYYMVAVQPGWMNFYAIVNADVQGRGLTLPTAQTWKSPYEVSATTSQLADYNTADSGNGFVMAILEGGVRQQIFDDVTVEQAQAGPNNKVSITVERMVAKVTVKLSDDLVATDGFNDENFTLTDLTCQLINADNIEYKAATEPGGEASYVSAGTNWMAWTDNNVRKTPSYDYPDNANDLIDIDEAKLASGDAQALYDEDLTTKNPSLRYYCLENTHANYYMGNTTFLKMEAQMIPNNLVTFTSSEGVISVENKTEDVTTPSTFYLVTAGYAGDGQKNYCVLASDLLAGYGTIATGGETEDAAKIAAVIDALEEAGYAFTAEYTDGKGVYRIPVNDLENADGSYANKEPVFRNDWYDLSITGISLPGDPAGDGFDPEEPFHPTTNVAVTLTVRDWNKVVYDDVVLQ